MQMAVIINLLSKIYYYINTTVFTDEYGNDAIAELLRKGEKIRDRLAIAQLAARNPSVRDISIVNLH